MRLTRTESELCNHHNHSTETGRRSEEPRPFEESARINQHTASIMSQNEPSALNQDFIIREGFPVLRKDDGQPWLEGEEPLPSAPVSLYPDFLMVATGSSSSSLWSTLYQDCRTVFSARTRDNDQAYSAGVTYFLPAEMKPRCALEAMVRAIFVSHTANLPKGSMVREQSGAEWWTLVLDNDDNDGKPCDSSSAAKGNTSAHAAAPVDVASSSRASHSHKDKHEQEEDEEEESDEVGLHFDADYGLEQQVTNLFVHPRVATVTYLTSSGSPTVVLDRRSPQQGNMEALNGDIQRGWLFHPTRGRHLAFDGRLLHGAPATFFPPKTGCKTDLMGSDSVQDSTKPPPTKKVKVETESKIEGADNSSQQRITLLVNVWVNHCPMDAEPLDDDICEQLSTPMDALQCTTQLPERMTLEKQVCLAVSSDDPAGEEEVVIGNRIVTACYGPSMIDLHAAAAMASSVEMTFGKGALCLVVGQVAPQDTEDDSASENED